MIEHGPVIGHYGDGPIYDFILVDGRKLHYERLATVEKDGSIDLKSLREGECIVHPGLVYQANATTL